MIKFCNSHTPKHTLGTAYAFIICVCWRENGTVYILQRPGSAALRTLPDERAVAPPTMECTFSLLNFHIFPDYYDQSIMFVCVWILLLEP